VSKIELWFAHATVLMTHSYTGHVPARCVKPSGRSLEPRSNSRPRGMVVPQEQSGGQNSAYRSGCLITSVSLSEIGVVLSTVR
jgi:hypothetical protein